MDSPFLSALTLGNAVSPAATVAVLLCCGLAGLACFIALFARTAPNWLRADFAIAAVGLYAFAFGRLQILESQTSAQIIAYSLGFILASSIGPLTNRLRTGQEPEE